ncbi:MAG: pilus assembly protein, partial [Noviherbaspirillum sp.]
MKTFAIDVDEGGNGQIDDNTRSIKPRNSQLYLAAKYGGFEDRNNDGNPFITLASDGKTVVKGSNAEWDNGKGMPSNYFLAGQPKEMIKSIRKIFDAIGAASGTISGVSVSTTKILSDGAFVYQPGFESSKWSGKLLKLSLKSSGDGTVDIAREALWDAGEILTGTAGKPANPAPEARSIYTAKVTGDGSLSTIEFKWDKLTEPQKAFLDTSPVDKAFDGRGEKRVNFLRGDRSHEASQTNGIFRTRERVLGDIINSNPVLVGAPATNVQGAGYQEFYKNNENRSKVVYVGANDGMLHAFSADDGKELFAYVPNAVIPRLNLLPQLEYEHQPYVDGAMSAGEAWSGGRWRTVLVSGLGGGAQGVFALDVTNPGNFGRDRGAIFEFTDADDPDMGNLMSAPVIAKFRTSLAGGASEYKYFAVVASGVNNYKADGYRDDGRPKFNTDASAALFLLSLDKPASAKWQENVNYYKFRVPSKDSSLQSGLSTPA